VSEWRHPPTGLLAISSLKTINSSLLLNYYYYARLTVFSKTTWISRYQKGKTSLDLNEARDCAAFIRHNKEKRIIIMGFRDGSGISWTICKQSAPCSWQITTPTPHHSIFTGRMLFLTPNQQCQSTEGT